MQSKHLLTLSAIAASIAAFYATASTTPTVASQVQPVASQVQPVGLQALPNAKPGECYAKVVIPAQYKTENVKVVEQEASVRFVAIPAQYALSKEQVLVKEATQDIVPVPAVYETVQETIELSPAKRTWLGGRSFMAKPTSNEVLSSISNSGVNLSEQPEGTCLSEYYAPPQYKTEQIKVLKSAPYEQVVVEPAIYDWVQENVLVKEASRQLIEIPAVYETVSEQVLVSPATTEWKSGNGLYEKIDNTTGEIMCLVEVPAKYKTVTRNVLKTAATTREVEIPAEYQVQSVRKLIKPAQERRIQIAPTYETFEKSVMVAEETFTWQSDSKFRPENSWSTGQTVCLRETPAKIATVDQHLIKVPASTRLVEIPAEYRTVSVSKLVKASEKQRVEVPSVVKTVAKQVKISEEKAEWRKVLCETNVTPQIITDLQTSLKAAGFDTGRIDGQLDTATLRAVDEYQQTKGLERGGLTLNTLNKLGVIGI